MTKLGERLIAAFLENRTDVAKEARQILLDRDCAMLDGHCNCPREEGKSFPNCEKYPSTNPGHNSTR